MKSVSSHSAFAGPPLSGLGLATLALAAVCSCFASVAPVPPAGVDQVRRSFSGQFVINVVPPKPPTSRLISNLETNAEYIRLDPTILPVSCERIKQLLSRELGLGSPWMGKIFLSLYATRTPDDPVLITLGQFRDGWQYWVELPDFINRQRYVRAITQVLLLETANRTATEHSADIPVWLTEGLSLRLMLSGEMEIILPPPRPAGSGFSLATRVVNARNENPLELVHKQLCASPGMTFEQLSWPAIDALEGQAGAAYRNNAYFFLNELLQLDNGRGCLRAMLAQLPRYYNWQFAFLQAFRGYFQRPLDVEKWWTLHVEHFTGRELGQTWPVDESWRKLDEMVRSAVQARTSTNEMPLHMELKLQTIVGEWDRLRQDQALRQKVAELQMLRVRLTPELALLADEYCRVVSAYLQNRDHGGLPLLKKSARRHAAEQTVRLLDQLDSRRLELKPLDRSAVQASSRRQ
jgi:hypothetical protein